MKIKEHSHLKKFKIDFRKHNRKLQVFTIKNYPNMISWSKWILKQITLKKKPKKMFKWVKK